jgi:hypothetical protein
MMLQEFGQALWEHTSHAVDALALAPTPNQPPSDINTNGIVTFLGTKIAPILLGILGVVFIGRASRGEISKVLTSSAIAIIGLAFIAGAATLFFFGGTIVGVIFK